MRLRLSFVFVALACLLPLREAAAQSLEVHPGACVDATRLASALEAVGARVRAAKEITFRVAETDREVSVEVRRAGVVLGSRTIEAQGLPCDEVVDAVAVAIAVTTDALFLAPEEAASKAAEATATELVAVPLAASLPPPVEHLAPKLSLRSRPSDSPESAPSVAQTDPSSVHLATSLALGSSVGMLPQPSAVLETMLDVVVGPPPDGGVEPNFSARAGLFSALPTTSELGPAKVVTTVIAARLDLCGGAGGSLVRLRGCATAVGGGLVADGADDDGRLAVGGRIDLRLRIEERLGLQAGADLLANLAPNYVTRRGRDGGISDLQELGVGALIFSGGPVLEFF